MDNDISNEPASVGELVGRNAVDCDGDKIGSIFDVYVDNDTGQPQWLAISTGLFGTKVSFAPLAGASLVDDDVYVAYTKSHVKDAPRAEADGQLSPEEEDELYAHYGAPGVGTVGTTDMAYDTETAAPRTDDAMTRYEEELDVSKTMRPSGTARLRKWIETEDVQMTIPIRREKAKLVTEPVTDETFGAATSGPDLTESEHEITLSEEVVDVDKRVVPKERVRLETDVETDEVVVDEEVRKERIDVDHDSTR
jgi:uncharacterized protein (TIGR02271 family)